MRRPSLIGTITVLLIFFLYAPLLVLTLFAFNGDSRLTFPIESLSTRWFAEIFDDRVFEAAFLTSLKAAAITSVIAAIVATAAAIAIVRRPSRLTAAAEAFAKLPVMVPPLLIGVAIFVMLVQLDAQTSLFTVVVGHLVFVIPYVVVVVLARMRGLEPEIEAAARDLGAGPLEVLAKVTVPMLAPAVLGGALLAFAFSFDEVLITNFTVGTDSTLPLFLFSKIRRSVDPSVNAVAVLLIAVPLICVFVASLIARRSNPSSLLRGAK